MILDPKSNRYAGEGNICGLVYFILGYAGLQILQTSTREWYFGYLAHALRTHLFLDTLIARKAVEYEVKQTCKT